MKETMTPASTSPLPAVPSRGRLKGASSVRPAGSAMTVWAPLSTTTWLQATAAAWAAARRSSSVLPGSLPRRWSSPGCGVSTQGRRTRPAHPGMADNTSRAPASTTAGGPSAANRRCTSPRLPGPGATPGPTKSASCADARMRSAAGAGSTSPALRSGRPRVTSSGTRPASRGCSEAGSQSVTMPLPARSAAAPAMRAAPAKSSEPATTVTRPKVPLWPRGSRTGSRLAARSASSSGVGATLMTAGRPRPRHRLVARSRRERPPRRPGHRHPGHAGERGVP